MNGLISAVGEMDEAQDLEGFLRDIAINKNVHVIGLFDCCRREKGKGGMYTQLEETHNLVCIYREECHEFTYRTCPCEPWALPNMAEEFFDHLKARHAASGDPSRPPELNMREDFLTFRDGAV